MTGIGVTQNLVASSGTLPILANVLLEADSDGVNLITTDLECFAKVRLEAKVEEAGRMTVPAKTLADIIRLLPDDDVLMVTSGTRLKLTCNRNVYQLTTMSPDDYPDWPTEEAHTRLSIQKTDLRRLLHNTLFAIPTRDPRRVLTGVLFELKEGRLTCVATDGRKLGKSSTTAIEVDGKDAFEVVIPGRILGELERALDGEGEIEMAISDQRATFKLSDLNLTYLTSLIEEKFPQYDAVIPASFKKALDLPKDLLDEAIDRASILAERKHHSIILNFGKKAISIKAQSFEDGSYEGEIEIDYDGEPFEVAFNHNYLHEVFRIAPDPMIKMRIHESAAPIVFQCESDADSLYLVMPVRIHDLESESKPTESTEAAAE